jgi:hypothetical protein
MKQQVAWPKTAQPAVLAITEALTYAQIWRKGTFFVTIA